MNTTFQKLLLLIPFLLLPLTLLHSQTSQRVARTPALNYDWRPGFISITELTGAIGLSITDVPYSRYYYGITTLAGYQFTRNIKGGAGLGVQFHNGGTLFPVFIDGRFSLSAQHIVPFASMTGGLALSLKNFDEQTYVFVNPMIGLKWVALTRKSIALSAGLMIMSGEFTRNSFINFKLGLELKGR